VYQVKREEVESGERFPVPVDLIRTVAMIFVILLHAAVESYTPANIMSPQAIQYWWTSDVYHSISILCVPLFIMLTGALLLQPSKADEPVKVFLKKRWSRIGLPFLFWGATYFVWSFFVNGQALTVTSILQGILAGPYYQFWFLYALVGLYLLTPLIRVTVAHANWETIRYFFLIWFVGTSIIPLLTLYANISSQASWFNQNVFVLTGLIGYFILGAYVSKLRVHSSTLMLILVLSSLWTIIGTYFLVGTLGVHYSSFFLNDSSFNVIIASVALFLVLASVPSQTVENRFPHGNRVIKLISQNTLAIYLFHVIVLETLQKGYLGFKISVTTMNPIIEIPLITAVTLLICLAVIVPLKEIPYVKKIIG
jgi:surface polysaccharide O-acyltransferase-like enzyme